MSYSFDLTDNVGPPHLPEATWRDRTRARENAREGMRRRHEQNDLAAGRAERTRLVDHVARRGLEAIIGRNHDRGQNAEGDDQDLRELADAEPDDDQRKISGRGIGR